MDSPKEHLEFVNLTIENQEEIYAGAATHPQIFRHCHGYVMEAVANSYG